MSKFRFGVACTLAVTALSAACAAGTGVGAAPAGPQTNPVTGEEYPPGTPPSETEYSVKALLGVTQGQALEREESAEAPARYQMALSESLAGIEAEPGNPIHYYGAGLAYAGLRDYQGADSMFTRAVEIYPAYELDVDPAREQAWVNAFNQGAEQYNAGDADAAVRAWTNANLIYDKRPESYQNLAIVHTQAGDVERATDMYQEALAAAERQPVRELSEEEAEARAETKAEVLANLGNLLIFTERFAEAEEFYRGYVEDNPQDIEAKSNLAVALARQGKQGEARALFDEVLADPALDELALFRLGVSLFQAEEYELAASAFERVTEANPHNRDAWYNWENSLYARDRYREMIPIGERLAELDPANESANLILARAYRELEQNREALRVLRANEAFAVHLRDLRLRPGEEESTVEGEVVGNAAAEGTPVRLRFTFYADGSAIGTETVTVSAPAEDTAVPFEVVFRGQVPATGYGYQVVE
ncbi:MAG: tetratricopeptide repeat protein [Longimicrobiaceae bacterium]